MYTDTNIETVAAIVFNMVDPENSTPEQFLEGWHSGYHFDEIWREYPDNEGWVWASVEERDDGFEVKIRWKDNYDEHRT